MRETKLLDERQFMLDQSADFFGNAGRITWRGAGPGQFAEILERSFAGWRQFIGIFIAQFVQLKRALLGNFKPTPNGAGPIDKVRPLQIPGTRGMLMGFRECLGTGVLRAG